MMKIPKNPAYMVSYLYHDPQFNHNRPYKASVNSIQMNIPPINAATRTNEIPDNQVLATRCIHIWSW